jgi:hypothetical protein
MRAVARTAGSLLLIFGMVAFVLVGCPSYRDGVPGELAQGRDDAESAARSAALALDLWGRGQSTRQATAVQLSDARDEVVKASKDVAELKVDDHIDLDRQRFLMQTMTRTVIDLNAANAAIRAVSDSSDDPVSLRRELLGVAELLAGQDR